MNVNIEIINQPRLLKISDDEYFNNPEYRGMISNSRLGLIDDERGGSIQAFLEGFGSQSYNQSFLIGSAVHDLKLQPESYHLSDIDAPSGKMLAIANYLIDKGVSDLTDEAVSEAIMKLGYKGNNVTPGKISLVRESCGEFVRRVSLESESKRKGMIFLSASERITVEKCVSALDMNREISSLLDKCDDEFEESYNEYAIFADIRVTVDGKPIVLKIKGKLDRFVLSENVARIYDLKTTSHSAKQFNASIEKYKYYTQAAFYKLLLASMGYDVREFKFLVVSTYDFTTGVYRMSGADIKRGQDELSRLFGLAALAIMDYSYKRDFDRNYSLKRLPVPFVSKMKVLSLMCFLLQKFRKKNPEFTVKELIERVRKEKMCNTSNSMVDKLTVWVEDMYSDDEVYPTFKMDTPKEISEYLNGILDKELPFSMSDYKDDLPF